VYVVIEGVNSMTEHVAEKKTRERSPSFPFISLKAAAARLTEFEQKFGRQDSPADRAYLAWGYKGDTSQSQQTLAALKHFGLVEYKGSGPKRLVALSEDARTFLRAQQETLRKEVLKRVALKPKWIAYFWPLWGAQRGPDEICLDTLVFKQKFNHNAAPTFLSVYDETIAFAGLTESDKKGSTETVPSGVAGQEDEDKDEESRLPSPPAVKVGDHVQWTSNGVDQFNPPRKVVELLPDGIHAIVFASKTGIPMSELVVVEPPKTPQIKPVTANSAYGADNAESKSDYLVLMRGDRLEITADVDAKGLEKLRAMLEKYAEILKMMN
jgi:hypothetical protein